MIRHGGSYYGRQVLRWGSWCVSMLGNNSGGVAVGNATELLLLLNGRMDSRWEEAEVESL